MAENKFGLTDRLKNRENKTNLLRVENIQKSTFDYSKIDIEDKNSLINSENMLFELGNTYTHTTIEIGKILLSARDKLAKYGEGTFMEWYINIGFNKDNVSYFLKRYSLYLKYQEKENYIAGMSTRLVKELTQKDAIPELVAEVIKNEINTTKEYNELKKKYKDNKNITNLNEKKIEFQENHIIEYIESVRYNEEEKTIDIYKKIIEMYLKCSTY